MKKICKVIVLSFCLLIAISFSFNATSVAANTAAPIQKSFVKYSDCGTLSDPSPMSCHTCLTHAKGGKKKYWVKSGKVYHYSKSCRTLSRSKKIYSGSVKEAKAAGKKRACKVCD